MPAEARTLAELRTGLVESVLRELCDRLELLAATGETTSIDLRSLPMTDADRTDLDARLGRGEVEAVLAVSGRSQVWETGFSGVWWIRHFGAGEKISSEEIVVAAVPDILASHKADISASAERLAVELDAASTALGENGVAR